MADEATEQWLDFVVGLDTRLSELLAVYEVNAWSVPAGGGAGAPSGEGCGGALAARKPADGEVADALLGAWMVAHRLHALLDRCAAAAPEAPSTPVRVELPAILR